MTKMPKMKKIPNLFLLIGRDDQLTYFILLIPSYDKINKRNEFQESQIIKKMFIKQGKKFKLSMGVDKGEQKKWF